MPGSAHAAPKRGLVPLPLSSQDSPDSRGGVYALLAPKRGARRPPPMTHQVRASDQPTKRPRFVNPGLDLELSSEDVGSYVEAERHAQDVQEVESGCELRANQLEALESRLDEKRYRLQVLFNEEEQQKIRMDQATTRHQQIQEQLELARITIRDAEERTKDLQSSYGLMLNELQLLQEQQLQLEQEVLSWDVKVAALVESIELNETENDRLRAQLHKLQDTNSALEERMGSGQTSQQDLSEQIDTMNSLLRQHVEVSHVEPSRLQPSSDELALAYRCLGDHISMFTRDMRHQARQGSLSMVSLPQPQGEPPVLVTKLLALGSSNAGASELRSLGVGAIVNLLQVDAGYPAPRYEAEGLDGVPTLRVAMEDNLTYSICDRLDTVLQFLDKQEARGVVTFVHCNMGLNRAPTVAIAYLARRAMGKEASAQVPPLTLLQVAWTAVARCRGQSVPVNPWFQKQLVIWALNSFETTRATSDAGWHVSRFRSCSEWILKKRFKEASASSRDAFASELLYSEAKSSTTGAFDLSSQENCAEAAERINGYIDSRLKPLR